jgi:predicted cupin superfamily sugar epimerase
MVADLIEHLGLREHPEGGWYREIYRSAHAVQLKRGSRARCTAIYYLLDGGTFSAWHRVASDEVWSWFDGDPLELHQVDEAGHRSTLLGRDVLAGQEPQAVVPAGVWQAAAPTGRFTLCGCVVAPGFAFADFVMPSREQMLALFPHHADLMRRFTREPGGGSPASSGDGAR